MVESRNFTTSRAEETSKETSGGASGNVVYTCPPHHDTTIDFLHASNGSSSTQNVTLQFYHADTNAYHNLINDKSVAGKDVYNVVTSDRIHMHEGDKIIAFDGAGGSMEIFISVRQFYNPSR